MTKIELDGGKYTVVNELNEGGGLKALRYGEEWRNLAGDNLVLAMYHEIERLREQIEEIELQRKADGGFDEYIGGAE